MLGDFSPVGIAFLVITLASTGTLIHKRAGIQARAWGLVAGSLSLSIITYFILLQLGYFKPRYHFDMNFFPGILVYFSFLFGGLLGVGIGGVFAKD